MQPARRPADSPYQLLSQEFNRRLTIRILPSAPALRTESRAGKLTRYTACVAPSEEVAEVGEGTIKLKNGREAQ